MATFYKNNPTDKVWWLDTDQDGYIAFSFDRKRIFALFRDYPQELSKEQKEIFDKENPFWVDFFS